MTLLEAAQRVRDTHSCVVIRARKEQDPNGPIQYDVKDYFGQGRKGGGWTALDACTAGAICAVGEALSEANRAKYLSLPLMKAVNVTWKLVA